MASFTSTPTTFNNYIETTPVQAEVAVGLEKERQFKEGIQKVQGYVDAIAGLDIAKQEDRDYVSNKLNEVKKGITKNLSGDFSDMRITNQIGGAATHIFKDPIVQGATISTANYRKGVSEMDAAVKSGKSSPENEWDFQDNASKWLNDKSVGTSFNGQYTSYVDVMDDFLKTWKEVHPDSKLTQDAFRQDANGKIVVNEALNEESREGITPDKVKQVSDLVFSKPQNQRQLDISGRYKYRGILPSHMYQTLQANYAETIDNVNTHLTQLQVKMATDKSVDKELVTKQIEQWKNFGSNTLEQFKTYSEALQSNPEGAKALIYKDEQAQKLMNSFSWTKESNQIKNNPLWDAQMDTLKYELDLSKFDWEKQKDMAEINLKKLKLESETDVKGIQTVTVPKNIEETLGNAGSQSFYDIKEDFHQRFRSDMREGVNLIANASKGSGGNILPPWKKDANLGWIPNVDPTGKTGYKNAEEAQSASSKIYADARATWNNGSGSDPLVNDMFNKIDPTLKAIEYYDKIGTDIEDKFKTQLAPFMKLLDSKGLPKTIEATYTQEGAFGIGSKEVTAYKADISDLVQLKIYNEGKKLFGEDSKEAKSAKAVLVKKLGETNFKDIVRRTGSASLGSGKGNTDPKFKAAYNTISDLAKNSNFIQDAIAREQSFKDAQIGFNPGQTNFVPKDENQAKTIITRVKSLADERSKGNNTSSFEDILSELKISKDKNTDAMAKTIGWSKVPSANGDKYYLSVNGKSAEVTATDLQSIFPGTELNDPFWSKHGTTLGLTGRTTTDVNGMGIERAYPVKMPYNSKYAVKYHLVGNGNGDYSLKLYINDTKGNKILDGVPWTLTEGLMNQQETQKVIERLASDAVVEAIINQNK